MGAAFGIGMQLGTTMMGMFSGGGGGGYNAASSMYAFNPMEPALQMQERMLSSQSALYGEQADLALAEAVRDARVKAREARKFKAEQSIKFVESGVLATEGTPIEFANDTVKLASEEIRAIMDRGASVASSYRRQGFVAESQGQAQILSARNQFLSRAAQAQAAGVRATSNNFGAALGALGQSLAGLSVKGAGGLGGFGFGSTPMPPAPAALSMHGPIAMSPWSLPINGSI